MSASPEGTRGHFRRRTAGAAPALAILVSGVVHAGIILGAGMVEIAVPEAVVVDDGLVPTFTLDLRATSVLAEAPEEGDDEPAPPALEEPAPEEPAPEVDEPALLELAQLSAPIVAPSEVAVPPEVEPPPSVDVPPPEVAVEEPPLLPVERPPEPVVQASETVVDPAPATPGVTGDAPATEAATELASAPTAVASGSGADPAAPAPASPPATAPRKPDGATEDATGLGGAARDDGLALRTKSSPRPAYPEAARRRGEQGTVTCQLTIARDGSVLEVAVVTSSGFAALDEAAVKALKKWRFESLERLTTKDRAYALQRLTFELSAAKR